VITHLPPRSAHPRADETARSAVWSREGGRV
jgi:hypothetical protein